MKNSQEQALFSTQENAGKKERSNQNFREKYSSDLLSSKLFVIKNQTKTNKRSKNRNLIKEIES